ncbi:MAG TPA: cupin, partial [Nodosilinea sp.]|nr:cupin [Nodosilinea sp.]
GDFMGFAAGGMAHSLSNPFDDDLVYLVGGLRLEFDICDYPRVNTRLYRRGEQREYVALGDE